MNPVAQLQWRLVALIWLNAHLQGVTPGCIYLCSPFYELVELVAEMPLDPDI